MLKKYYYVINFQYLGYRYHGWQKQPKLKTLHLMVDRTLNYILEGDKFKTLVSGRTDAMVSANQSAFELFVYKPIENLDAFLALFNYNLPQDIRALSITEVTKDFNIINNPKQKEYLYYFAFGEKNHPFCASILTTILDDLDIDLMMQGATLFKGTHNFKSYCYKPTNKGVYTRTIMVCELIRNTTLTASFFPKTTYALRVVGKGFMRSQIRLMMGTLIDLGKHNITLERIKDSLKPNSTIKMNYIAPASGLILNKVEFE